MTAPTVVRDEEYERGRRRMARQRILRAANRFIQRQNAKGLPVRGGGFTLLAMMSPRHINQAVRIVRHNGLLDASVLEAAGFNGRGPTWRS